MAETIKRKFWIFEPDLNCTLLLIAHVAKYDIDSDDLNAIIYGLTSTSQEKDIWWTYQFVGNKIIDLCFARDDDNTDIIFIELSFSKELSSQIDLCIFAVQDFYLQQGNNI
ncbi:hypothetical protein [Solitalea canadensis]|uniref:Uncharacterized protein n=1 Tax=Solitalea canadensis (strain ATCC 29591 / DSM 3403 / JCM 21819 / LMG 8368 / NBRC 15130 / NCIMB 12057 / USAM 9D) TaxID=929556 RepID=H8KLA4_SOLCM|nr:hypothetical protein [Solitalea canadensis]AFD08606.1 hypothetical protein Solca_3602 [Solitalea canadensis DSM 3403]